MEIVHKFSSLDMAWGFLARCESSRAMVGFPSLGGAPYTVRTINVVTVEQAHAVRAMAGDDNGLVEACNAAVWEADAYGVMTSLTPSCERLRVAVVAMTEDGTL